MTKRLYRSRDNRVLCGICGGIGDYLGIDPVIVRIILVVLCLIGFSGVLAYIIAIFLIPEQPVMNVNVPPQQGETAYKTVTKNVVESEAVVTEEVPSDGKNEN